MASQKLIDALNKDLADELGATIQYLWHHFMCEGLESPAISDLFSKTAMDEMKHIEKLGERIVYLGGQPGTKPSEAATGGNLTKMVQDDLAAENRAIAQYRAHVKLAGEENDPVTRLMLENILADEEGHADSWETVLGIRKG
ncbi:MAG: ferritin [Chloroflexi bacterium]|nr:ferritin [Chloroflexota bacterium]